MKKTVAAQTAWWDHAQTLAWIYTRDSSLVADVTKLALEPSRPWIHIELWLQRKGGKSAQFASVALASASLVTALQSEKLECAGILDGRGERQIIPSLALVDAKISFHADSANRSGSSGAYLANPRPNASEWTALSFRRENVFAVWPAGGGVARIAASSTARSSRNAAERQYKIYVQKWVKGEPIPSRDEDLVHMRSIDGLQRIPRDAVRALRRDNAPPEWQARGRPKNKATK